MLKHLKARAAQEEQEERTVRKLAKSHHAPADWKFHAQMVVQSWAGKTPSEIGAELGCHPIRTNLRAPSIGARPVPVDAERLNFMASKPEAIYASIL